MTPARVERIYFIKRLRKRPATKTNPPTKPRLAGSGVAVTLMEPLVSEVTGMFVPEAVDNEVAGPESVIAKIPVAAPPVME